MRQRTPAEASARSSALNSWLTIRAVESLSYQDLKTSEQRLMFSALLRFQSEREVRGIREFLAFLGTGGCGVTRAKLDIQKPGES